MTETVRCLVRQTFSGLPNETEIRLRQNVLLARV